MRRGGRWAAALIGVAVIGVPSAFGGNVHGGAVKVSANTPPKSALNPSLAYDSQNKRYLAVWNAHSSGSGATTRQQIFGRFLKATGKPQGGQFAISDEGPPVNTDDTMSDPIVVYNSSAEEFLVVWHASPAGTADNNCGPPYRTQIFGQRVSSTGAQPGTNDFPISSPSDPAQECARDPQVVYNSQDHEYLVVWGNDPASSGPGTQVYGQLLDTTGTEIGGDDFPISSVPTLNQEPTLAYDRIINKYLVVWHGTPSGGDEEQDQRPYGQRLNADGTQAGANDFEVGKARGGVPTVVFNPKKKEFLVVWQRDKLEPNPNADTKHVVLGQRLSETGALKGKKGFLISEKRLFQANVPNLAYDSKANRYDVVFEGVTKKNKHREQNTQIFGQQLRAKGKRIGNHSFLIAKNRGDEEPRSVVYNRKEREALVGWEHFRKSDGGTDIFARRVF